MDENIILRLENVRKVYKMGKVNVVALDNISLSVRKGEFLLIMGPSGSGKSTFMNIIGCLDLPTRGKIYLDGVDISELSESKLAQIRGNKIGFIFQQFNLMPGLTAIENVELPMIFQRIDKKKRKKRASELLELLGLSDRINHFPNELSGGQQQRVAIARALVNNPEILLGDEPTGNIDTKTGDEVMQILKDLHRRGRTVIVVTHDPSLKKYADRVIYLRDGKIVGDSIL